MKNTIDKSPLVSIITPCFNDGAYIEATVLSVLSSDYANIELIIIDDGSTDNTQEVLSKFKDSRITVKKQKNSGVIEARNFGMSIASGKYIMLLDSDDLVSKKYVQLCVNALEEDSQIQLVTSNYKLFGKENKVVSTPEFNMTKLLGSNLFIITSMFRKERYDLVGGFNLNMSDGLEDWDFWIKVLKRGGKVFKIPEAHFFYRIKALSRNSVINADMHRKLRRQIWENHKEIFSEVFFDPEESFEFKRVACSKEFMVGRLLLAPLRRVFDR